MAVIFRRVARSGVPFSATAYRVTLSETHTTYWDWSLQPLADETGKMQFLLQTINNVTNQIDAPLALRESQQPYQDTSTLSVEQGLLRTLLDQFSEGILIVDITTGLTSYANEAAAQFLGLSLPELLHTPLHEHLWYRNERRGTPLTRTSHSASNTQMTHVPWLFPVVHALCGETVKAQETLIPRHDGSTLPVLTTSVPLSTEQGMIVGAVVILQNISLQKSGEQYKHDFISAASHELRTPITTIQGLAELLQISIARGQALQSTHVRRILDRLSEQSQHLTHLVTELLDVSLLEQRQFTLNQVHCDLLPLVVRGIEYFTATNASYRRSVHLSLEGPIATGTLLGNFDKERIEHTVRNLVGNAIKYSPASSPIEIKLHYDPDHPHETTLSVRDEGFGIPAHELPHIFERFRRSQQLDPSINGLGTGLYLAREIVTRHNGRIWVKSIEGRGSTFYVVLPIEGYL